MDATLPLAVERENQDSKTQSHLQNPSTAKCGGVEPAELPKLFVVDDK